MTTLLYRWLDRRGRIPRWVHWIYPNAHWCDALDYALILNGDCCCERRNGTNDHDYTNERKPF
jgi:hypothetical protein